MKFSSLKQYVGVSLLGALIGLLIIHPFSMVVFYFQFGEFIRPDLFQWLSREFHQEFLSRKEIFQADVLYMLFGSFLSLFIYFIVRNNLKTKSTITLLTQQLEQDLGKLLAQGESDILELKSSIRWDFSLNKVNKSLEKSILKTIAGFLNNNGGTLLVGVDDDAKIIGLHEDIQTLKKKNLDGYELFLRDLISLRLGTDLNKLISIIFHHIENLDICRITIGVSSRPVYLKDGQSTDFFLRSGGSTRSLNIQEAIDYIHSHF